MSLAVFQTVPISDDAPSGMQFQASLKVLLNGIEDEMHLDQSLAVHETDRYLLESQLFVFMLASAVAQIVRSYFLQFLLRHGYHTKIDVYT